MDSFCFWDMPTAKSSDSNAFIRSHLKENIMSRNKSKLIPSPFDQYTFMAQYVPAIIVSIPAMMLLSQVKVEQLQRLFQYAYLFLIVKNVGLSAIVITVFTHAIRCMGKYGIELFLFQNGLHFPTTDMLL